MFFQGVIGGLVSPYCSVIPEIFNRESGGFLPFFLLPPLAGGSARVPCQIIDLAGWEREGEVTEEKCFLRKITLSPEG